MNITKPIECNDKNFITALEKINKIFGHNRDFYYIIGYHFEFSPCQLFEIENRLKRTNLVPLFYILYEFFLSWSTHCEFIRQLEDFMYESGFEDVYYYQLKKLGFTNVLNSVVWASKEKYVSSWGSDRPNRSLSK